MQQRTPIETLVVDDISDKSGNRIQYIFHHHRMSRVSDLTLPENSHAYEGGLSLD